MTHRASAEQLLRPAYNSTVDTPTPSHFDDHAHAPAPAFTLADMVPTQRDKTGMTLVLTGSALLFLCTAALVLTSPVPKLFMWHPPLNALALVLVALAIAAVQPPTPAPAVREQRLDAHKGVATLGVVALCAGTTFMYYNKEANGSPHGTTPHGSTGYIVLAWILTQMTVGGIAVNIGKRGLWLYKWHRRSGYLFTAVALFTAFAGGLLSPWAQGRPAPLRIAAYGVGIPLIAAGLAMRVQTSKLGFGGRRA